MGRIRVIDNPRESGTVGLIIPARKAKRSDESESDFEQRVFAKAMQNAGMQSAGYEDIDISQVPTDRTFRKAWERGTGTIRVEMTKARKIHMGRIRGVVNAELKKRDELQYKALVSKNQAEVDRIETQKQTLRGFLTTNLETAATPETLKAIWPSGLPAFDEKIHVPEEE